MPTFTVETGVMVPMRDGVRLATDVYRPTEGPTPTLLTRTPYNKDVVAGFSDDLDLFRALRAGYAVVAQDVRGRFASEGTFDAYHQEAADGADTIAWIAAQPYKRITPCHRCSRAAGAFGHLDIYSDALILHRVEPGYLKLQRSRNRQAHPSALIGDQLQLGRRPDPPIDCSVMCLSPNLSLPLGRRRT